MSKEILRLRQANIYQGDNLILKGVTFKLEPGEFVYLIGKTGSGKSSLLKTLYGALPLEQGIGDVADFDLTTMDRKTIPLLRRKIGIVFQDFNLLSDRTVAANLTFVLKATDWKGKVKIQERIEEVLSEVGLEGKEDKMPHQLSGG
ncbi:MAG: ATP-binding cassette domain-containing protein, partial [Bacteroidota bacterium]